MAPARDIYAADLIEGGGVLSHSSASEDEPLAVALRPGRGRRLLLAAAATAAAVASVAYVATRQSPHKDSTANTEESVELVGGMAGLLSTAASGLKRSAKLLDDVQTQAGSLEGDGESVLKPFEKIKAELKGHPGVSDLKVNLTKMSNMSKQELLHPKTENRNDGNLCPDDEELHATLCYKKCSLLTNGKYPIRTTAFSCCMQEPCSFFNSKFTNLMSYCSGFDVSGNAEGKECPHAPGSCMPNEEFNLGQCYKKCAILTNNTFPYRSAASTCCRYQSHIACLDAMNTLTNMAFDVGGGMADNHTSTPNMSHAPMLALTEKGVPTVGGIPAPLAVAPTMAPVPGAPTVPPLPAAPTA